MFFDGFLGQSLFESIEHIAMELSLSTDNEEEVNIRVSPAATMWVVC